MRIETQEPIFFIPLIIGVVFTYLGMRMLKKGIDSESWPSTLGKITSSDINQEVMSNSRGGRSVYYSPKISYEYTVNGVYYKNSKLFWGEYSSTEREKVQEIVSKFPVGKSITVYHAHQILKLQY